MRLPGYPWPYQSLYSPELREEMRVFGSILPLRPGAVLVAARASLSFAIASPMSRGRIGAIVILTLGKSSNSLFDFERA